MRKGKIMCVNVAIIVPVYNTPENLLRACISSLITQTMKEVEILLIDDGSKDNSGRICDEYKLKDKRIKVIHSENKGVSNARNLGILNATAPYIMFVDADDYIKKDTCEKNYQKMNMYDYEVMFYRPTGTKYIDSFKCENVEPDKLRVLQIDIIRHSEDYDGYVLGSPWGKIFKRDFLIENNLFFTLGVKRSQDRLFMLYVLEKANKVAFFSYSGYTYIKNEESICNRYNGNIVDILDNAYDHIKLFVDQCHGNEVDFINALYQLRIRFMYTDVQLFYLNRKRKKNLIQSGKELEELFEVSPMKDAVNNIDMSLLKKKMKVFYLLVEGKHYYMAAGAYRIMDLLTRVRDVIK